MENIVALLTFVTTKLAKNEARRKETQRNKVLSSISLSLSLVMFWHFFLTCNKHKRLNDPDKNCTPSNISSIPPTKVYILSS